jgi:hypothetical protein
LFGSTHSERSDPSAPISQSRLAIAMFCSSQTLRM